ncbi:Hpt domain-containing protein [uncultured Kriegella sp.]|uniref:Hpt domain-containing protein n=1 Tax=uncultured Kriegella sp. TaxID=1798910 RepID=UPI0030DBD4DB|tara:strand:+ start:89048 stop:89365 length:318 start_codon:yes stop_codon:yes gene_type:complete
MDKPNLNYIKELAGDDYDFELEFISIVKQEFPIEHNIYKEAIEKKDFYAAWQIVHKLKHKLNILSMEEAYKLAVVFEEELKTEDFGRHKDFCHVLDNIDNFLKTI